MKYRILAGVAIVIAILVMRYAYAEIVESTEAQAGIPWSIIATTNTSVSSGSYTYTNMVDHPWWVSHLWYNASPSPDSFPATNTWTVAHVRRLESQLYAPAVVATNDWGLVETNDLHVLTNSVYNLTTNLLVNALVSTSSTYVAKSVNDLVTPIPQYDYVLPGDLLVFTWTRTGLSWTGRVDFGWAGRK
jgi:hypothetical protein